MTPPKSPYYDAAEAQIANYDGGRGEIIANYGKLDNEIRNSGNEFLGASTNDEVRQKTMDNRLFRSRMDKGRDLLGAGQNEAAYKNSAYMSLGGATAPQLVQTGGTANMTGQQWGSGLYSPLGQLGLQAGGTAIAA